MTTAESMRAWREKHGLTRREVADATACTDAPAVTERTIARWEAGHGEPPPSLVRRLDARWPGLGAALGLSPAASL